MSIDAKPLTIRVNGEQRRVASGLRIAQMLGEMGINPVRVAVERNLEVVARASLAEVLVEDGDDYEVVHFVGGG